MKNRNGLTPDVATGEQKLAAHQTTPGACDFISADQLLRRVPFSRGTLRARMQAGKLPYIRLDGRKLCFHWPSVEQALLRAQRGGQQ